MGKTTVTGLAAAVLSGIDETIHSVRSFHRELGEGAGASLAQVQDAPDGLVEAWLAVQDGGHHLSPVLPVPR